MRFLRSTALLVLVGGCRTAMPPAATYSANAEAEVLKAEREWANAMAGQLADVFAGYLDDGWVGFDDGKVLDKVSWANAIRAEKKETKTLQLANLKVRFPRPDVAVVTAGYRHTAPFGTKEKIDVGLYINTWVRKAGRWQLVSSAFTTLLKSP